MFAVLSRSDRTRFRDLKRLSMLSPGVLFLLNKWAAETEGAIVEIGPYIGGSTIAMADAVRDTNRPFVSFEAGGASSHPEMGTDDILRDLKANLAERDLLDRVTILEGLAHDNFPRLGPALMGTKIGLLFIDADGRVGFHISHLVPHLRPDCVIALDDYTDPIKGTTVRDFVDHAVAATAVEDFGLFGYGTWFGRVAGDPSKLPVRPFSNETGLCWQYPLPSDLRSDNMDSPAASDLLLFENGEPLGPRHAAHDEIRALGAGRYPHWRGCLYFSTSDGTNPNGNGRRYTAICGDATIALNDLRV